MEIIKKEYGWGLRNTHGPIPKELQGEWTSFHRAEEALMAFQARVRSKAKNVTEIRRKRAASNATLPD